MLESQIQSQKFNQSAHRQNVLDAKVISSIKRNEVREFIKTGSGSSELNFVQNDQNSQLSDHLMQLKTSCSGVKLQIKTKIQEHEKYKAETNFIGTKVKVMQQQRTNVQVEINKIRQIVEQVKAKKMNAMLSSKSYEHILDRMKKDEIKYQIKKNELQKQLKLLQKKSKDLMNKGFQLRQVEYLGSNGIKQANDEVKELSLFRKNTIENMNSIVQEKNVLKKKKQDRKDKSDMIKEMAAGDLQDADLIRMKKFLSVQQFLKVLLRNKMEKLKDFYEPYELAFLKIKCSTNIKDSNNLTIEYRNFQANYNQKSIWVKHLEDEIDQQNLQKLKLQQKYCELKNTELQILQMMEGQTKQQQKQNKKEIKVKSENAEKMMMSVREWLLQQAKRLNVDLCGKSDIVLLRQICEQLTKRKAC